MVSLPRDFKAECPRNKNIHESQKSHQTGRFCAEKGKKRPKSDHFRLLRSFRDLLSSRFFPKLFTHKTGSIFSDAARFCSHIFLIRAIQMPLLQYVPIAGFIRTDSCKEALGFVFGKSALDSPLCFPDGICQFGSRKSAVFAQVFQHFFCVGESVTPSFSPIFTPSCLSDIPLAAAFERRQRHTFFTLPFSL